MQVEHRIITTASPATIYRIYEEVENWHTWDPDTKQVTLDGPFQAGTTGRLVPTKGNAISMLLTKAIPAQCFTVESKIPLFRMIFEHELSQKSGATEIIHRITLSGFLSFILGPMLSRQMNRGLPVTLSRLKALAESRSVT